MSRARILIAEDEVEVLEGLRRILDRQGGFEVETSRDGAEALDKARALVPDLIISDYAMPTVNGFELCKAVKLDPLLSGCMFVVLTGFTDTALKVSGLNLGVDDYLTKPVEAPELLAKVRATLRIKALHDELREDKERLRTMHQELTQSFDNLLSVFIHLVDLKIPGSSTRGERLANRAAVMAKHMKVPEKFLRQLEIAARLHEIGRLVGEPMIETHEWHHLAASRAILDQVPQFKGAGSIVQAIGEHWDGTGYPSHLLQGQIPLRSRILRVLIDFDVAWERHAAHGSVSVAQVLDDLKRFAGTRYDPLIVTQLETAIQTSNAAAWRPSKKRVALTDLSNGMVLAEDLCTSSGVKLLGRGAQLTDTTLDLILRRHASDPIIYGACVEA